VERLLRKLQARVRESYDDRFPALSRTIPEDLALPGKDWISLGSAQKGLFEQAVQQLLEDQRFEYLDKKVDDAVWRFVATATLNRSTDQVPAFVEEYAHEPVDVICFFPIESLTVTAPRRLANSTLYPPNYATVPTASGWFSLDPPIGSVLAVPETGSSPRRIADRAAAIADHELRVLRIGLRTIRGVNDRQLRFRRSPDYALSTGQTGWSAHPHAPVELGLNDSAFDIAGRARVTAVGPNPATDLHRRAALAARWLERAMLETSPLESLLFAFFALEALIGDKSEGEKGLKLAFRRAMLSVAVSGDFASPNRTYDLYDRVRSAAVHGSFSPGVNGETALTFTDDVRDALDEYLALGEELGLRKRSELIRVLDSHPQRRELIADLTEFFGDHWSGVAPDS
jgi:hypothetical protein